MPAVEVRPASIVSIVDAIVYSPRSIVSRLAAASGTSSIVPYALPTQMVTQFLAVGDSFTAGLGSNGGPDYLQQSGEAQRYTQAYPMAMAFNGDRVQQWEQINGGKVPELNFGAWTGAKVNDPGTFFGKKETDLSNQLKGPGQRWRDLPFHTVDRPQLAVMTIGGNDLGFGNAVAACVFRVSATSCDDALDQVEAKITGVNQLRRWLSEGFYQTIAAGRQGRGADPPESFQLYVSGYVPFFYDEGPECNEVSWALVPGLSAPLTQALRKRLNGLTLQANAMIKLVAEDLASDVGTIYVEGFQNAYIGHQYCNPEPAAYIKTQETTETWFWQGGNYIGGGEGPSPGSGLSLSPESTLKQDILNLSVPDASVQATLTAENIYTIAPEYNSTWDDFIETIMQKEQQHVNSTAGYIPLSPVMKRLFHPKGTAYLHHASAFLNAIQQNRGRINAATHAVTSAGTQTPTPTPLPTTDPKPTVPRPNDHPGAGSPGGNPDKILRRGFSG